MDALCVVLQFQRSAEVTLCPAYPGHRGVATELLLGPVYLRLVFGGTLDEASAVQVVDRVLDGYRATDA